MQSNRLFAIVLTAIIGLFGVLALLNDPVSAQAPSTSSTPVAPPRNGSVTNPAPPSQHAPAAPRSASSTFSGHHILIAQADCATYPTTLRNNLLALDPTATVDNFNAGSGTPTLAQLQAYDTVVAYSDCAYANPTTLGNNLVTYMNGGGIVVAFNFSWYGGTQSISGTWQTGGYSPFNDAGTPHFIAGTLGTYTVGHPLMQGVSSLNSTYRMTLIPASGATQVAAWNDGTPLIAYKGRAVGISAYVGNYSDNWSGDFARVILNAANWLGYLCPVQGAIQNSGFETGSFSPGWVISATNPTPVITTTQVHSGAYSALLGTLSGPEPTGDGSIYQQFTVPANGGILSFWYWPQTTDTVSFDWQEVDITDLSGTILATIFHQASNAQTWTKQMFDLTPWAGQTVRVKFLVHEDGFGDDTAMYVDDVSLVAQCTCGTGVPNQWSLLNSLPTPVYGASVSNNGIYAYAFGGYSFQASGDVTQTVRYDPNANSFTVLAPLPSAATMASAVYAPINNKVYVFGGELMSGGQVFSTTRIYDIIGNSWTTGAPMPDVRDFMASGYYNGKIYLIGGYSTGSVTSSFAQTWEYDVLANTWLTKTAMPHALGGAGSAVVNGHLYVIGGRDASNTVLNSTYDYDILANTWFTRTNIPANVNAPGAAVVNGRILIPGGGTPFGPALQSFPSINLKMPAALSTTWIYDPVGNSWSTGPSLNAPRSFPGVTGFNNLAIALGGYDGSTTTGATEVIWMCSRLFLPLIDR